MVIAGRKSCMNRGHAITWVSTKPCVLTALHAILSVCDPHRSFIFGSKKTFLFDDPFE